jgi:AraC-like DNA-binding protein
MDFSFDTLEGGAIALVILLISLTLTLIAMLVNNITVRLRIMNITHVLMLIHLASNGLIYYHNGAYLYCFAPMFSVYGPMFFFHVKILTDSKLSKITVLMHLLPVIMITMSKVGFVISKAAIENFYFLLAIEGISLLAYGVYGFFTRVDKRLNVFNNAFTACGITFIICGIFTLLNVWSALLDKPIVNGHVAYLNIAYYAIWLLMNVSYTIAAILIVSNYKHLLPPSLLKKEVSNLPYTTIQTLNDFSTEGNATTERYKNSKLSKLLIFQYGKELAKLMQEKKVFLDCDLKLSQLARHLKISDYHLSQVLSTAIGDTFYGYVNKFRIKYAVALMQQDHKLSLEQIMIESGFNNRVSFNRYFKEEKNMHPSAFMQMMKSNTDLSEVN